MEKKIAMGAKILGNFLLPGEMAEALSEPRKSNVRIKRSLQWAQGWEVSPSSKNRAVEQLSHKDGSKAKCVELALAKQ